MHRKVFIQTFGCKMNEHDTSLILSLLKEVAIEQAQNPEEADILIVNACSVRESAERKALTKLSQFCAQKKRRPLVVGAVGCMAERFKEELLSVFPQLDFVVGPSHIEKIPSIIDSKKKVCVGEGEREILFPNTISEGVTASVPVMEGCSMHCTFCIVPSVRGKARSFAPERIIDHIKRLVQGGCKEVLLLGQCVNAYRYNGTSFCTLLERINDVEGLLRIKFTTSHPNFVTPSLIEAMMLPKVCAWLHLPVQSGSDNVLKRMRRGYTRKEYSDVIKKVRECIPNISITTDIMVGFPSESEKDFEDTLSLVEEVEFDHAFIFKFCPRPSTPAASFMQQIPEHVKAERLDALLNRQRSISAKRLKEFVGRVEEVLIEGENPKNKKELIGRSRTHKVVRIPFLRELIHKEISVKIKGVDGATLMGEPI